jgi:hypothetical protein
MLLLFVFVLCLSPARSQTSATGALTGIITDTSGAVLSGVQINVVNEATGEKRIVSSRPDGSYFVPQLLPGSYRVEASRSGFATLTRVGLRIDITETARLDLALRVGNVTEQVVVTASPLLVQTESSALGRVVNETVVTSLPLVARNYTQIVTLSPGISQSVTNAATLGRGTGGMTSETEGEGLFVHGTRQYDNSFQMDGIEINDLGGSGGESGGVAIPNPDTIKEFKVQTGQYDAAYGRGAGANVDIVTKGGSNDFHGSVWEFVRNNIFNANDFFLNQARQKRPDLKQNQFGFTLGGPIKRDKILFFSSYQGTRQINGIAQATTSPTTGSVGGCLSSSSGPPLTNDRSAAALGALFATDPAGPAFGGTTVSPDGSNINPIALRLLQMKLPDGSFLIPTPQSIDRSKPFESQGFSAFSRPCDFNENQFMTNADFLQSERSRFSGRYFFSDSNSHISFPQHVNIPGFSRVALARYQNVSIAHTYIFSPYLLNEFRAGFHRVHDDFSAQSPFSWSSLGVTAAQQNDQYPCILILGSNSACSAFPFAGADNTYDLVNSVSYVHGHHYLRFGAGLSRFQENFRNFRNDDQIEFLSYPDFLLGQDGGTNGSGVSNVFFSLAVTGLFDRSYRSWGGHLYAQDDYKLSRRFTLNAGLRYERIGYFSDVSGRNVTFDRSAADPNPSATGTLQGFVAANNYSGGALPAGVIRSGNDSATRELGKNNWAPRVGFSWQVLPQSSRFVLRGGYGIYYSLLTPQGTALQTAFTQPFLNAGLEFAASSPTFASPFQQPIPQLSAFPLWTPYSSSSSVSIVTLSPRIRPSMVQEYSLNLQAALAHNFLLEVGYVGTHGTHLLRSVNPNQAGLATPSAPIRGETTNTLANIPLRVPVEGFGAAGIQEIQAEGASWYNGLEVSMTKRVSHGLEFLASYTFSKTLDTDGANVVVLGSGGNFNVGNQIDPRARYGRSSFDRPQRFVFSYVYRFPAPNVSNSFAKTLLNGWQTSGVATLQSGNALTLVSTNANNAFGITNDRAELAPGCTNSQIVTPGAVTKNLNNYFNKSCLGDGRGNIAFWPIIGADGVATGFGNSGVGIANGPNQINFDLSVGKVTRTKWLGENTTLEFRGEFYNAFNHTQFANPVTDVSASNFGQILATSVSPRIVQLAVKLNF